LITGPFKSEDAVGVGHQPLEARGVGQEQPTPQPADLTATRSETGETTTGTSDVTGPGGSSAANVPLDGRDERLQDCDTVRSVNLDTGDGAPLHQAPRGPGVEQPTALAQRGDPIISRRSVQEGLATATNDSADVEWEPLIIGKFIEGVGVMGKWGWWLLVSLIWRWPNPGFQWLSHWWQNRRNAQ